MPMIARYHLEKGFFMLEVLITMVVMAIGMLGIAAMLMVAHKASSSSYLRQQASQSVSNMIDKMRANRQAAISGNYNISDLVASGAPTIPASPSPSCVTASCTTTQLAAYDAWYWLANDVGQLPNGAGSITTTLSGTNTLVTVTVQWNDSPAQTTLGASGQVSSSNSAIAQFSVSTSL
jgi:type IV pilus assembly protein PilV